MISGGLTCQLKFDNCVIESRVREEFSQVCRETNTSMIHCIPVPCLNLGYWYFLSCILPSTLQSNTIVKDSVFLNRSMEGLKSPPHIVEAQRELLIVYNVFIVYLKCM